jgi:gas vesicle protein
MGKFVCFFAGASIGATLAILFAPQSGKETRGYIGRQVRRGHEALAEAGRGAFETGRDLWKKGRALADEAAAEVMDRGKQFFES